MLPFMLNIETEKLFPVKRWLGTASRHLAAFLFFIAFCYPVVLGRSPTNLHRAPASVTSTGPRLTAASKCGWSESCYFCPGFTDILRTFSWEKAIFVLGFQSSLFTEVATAVNCWQSPPWRDCHRHCPRLAKWFLFVDWSPFPSWGHRPLAFLGRSGVAIDSQ